MKHLWVRMGHGCGSHAVSWLLHVLLAVTVVTPAWTAADAALTPYQSASPTLPYPRGWPPVDPLLLATRPAPDTGSSAAAGYGEVVALHTPLVVITATGGPRTITNPVLPPEAVDSSMPPGSAYAYIMPGGATDPGAGWTFLSPALSPPTPTPGDRFGWSADALVMDSSAATGAAIAPGDGLVAVGAPGADSSHGAVHLFHVPQAASATAWTRIDYDFAASASLSEASGRLGTSVALSQLDGVPFLAAGVPFENGGAGGVLVWTLYATATQLSQWTLLANAQTFYDAGSTSHIGKHCTQTTATKLQPKLQRCKLTRNQHARLWHRVGHVRPCASGVRDRAVL